MGEGAAEVEAPAFMPGRMSTRACRNHTEAPYLPVERVCCFWLPPSTKKSLTPLYGHFGPGKAYLEGLFVPLVTFPLMKYSSVVLF